MAKLTSKRRKKMKSKDFALPKRRAYPIHDKKHARNALSRVAQFGTPREKAKVRKAVKKRYPSLGNKSKKPKSEARA